MSDLTSPLGIKPPETPRRAGMLGMVASVLAVALAAAVVLWIAIINDPHGGEPVSVAVVEDVEGDVGRSDMTTVGVKSGSGQLLPPVEGQIVAPIAPAMPINRDNAAVDAIVLTTDPLADLLEPGPYGPIPKVGSDGARPLDSYARPVPAYVGNAPRIVVVVAGIGLSDVGSQEALRLLPAEVTLGLAPYGSDLGQWIARARQDGHELMLQIPMEPFDYPDNDPGPHTLVTSASREKNLDSLRWLLAQASTYVGVMGQMGARFTSDEAALGPVMAEITQRGLMYLDDGSSNRSRAASVATGLATPFAGADLVIDAVTTPAEIASRLAQLEQIARSRGIAVGTASALPVSVREIANWARTLEPRGVTLVPASAAVPPPPAPSP